MNQYILENAIQSILSDEENLVEGLNIADLGCGVGPVPLAFVTLVIEIVRKKYKELKCNNEGPVPRIQIYMNDLPSNDFNLLFRDILNLEVFKRKEGGVPLFLLMGAPSSYYERLFPSNSLHFVHASYTLHWFSQVCFDSFFQLIVDLEIHACGNWWQLRSYTKKDDVNYAS